MCWTGMWEVVIAGTCKNGRSSLPRGLTRRWWNGWKILAPLMWLKIEMAFTNALNVQYRCWVVMLNAWHSQFSNVCIEVHNPNQLRHCKDVPIGLLWWLNPCLPACCGDMELIFQKALRLEPRRRADGTSCFMEDSEHEKIHANLRKKCTSNSACVCMDCSCMVWHVFSPKKC